MDTRPAGLKVEPRSGEITGQPAKAGNDKAIVIVTDTAGASATREFDVPIAS